MKYIIGIDPGLTGGIADSLGRVLDLPTKMKGKGGGVIKNHIDGDQVYNIMMYWIAEVLRSSPQLETDVYIYIEEQVYRKKFKPKFAGGGEIPQGGSSIFSLGDSYGALRTAAELTRATVVPVMPAAWKKKLALSTDKEACRSKAIEVFPQAANELKRKKDHNRAEALLLVHYGMIMEGMIK